MARLVRKAIQFCRSIHIEARIEELGYKLPPLPPTPKGSYINFSLNGNILHVSGHLPQPVGGALIEGRLGENMTIEEGQHAARLAALQMLATVKKACHDLDNVTRVIKVVGFVNSTNDFNSQAKVMNGCSGLYSALFMSPTRFPTVHLTCFLRFTRGDLRTKNRATFKICNWS